MDYDFRSRSGPQVPMYRPPPSSSAPSSMYPKIGPHGHHAAVPVGRPSPYHQNSTPPSSSSSGLGIKVAVKPEYRITPPPHLSPHAGDIPRSNFQFDFGLERKILAEAEKDNPNWSKFGLDNLPTKVPETSSSKVPASDPIVSKYIAMGLSREAVPIAVAHYGDNPTKVQEFVNGYTLLREMGFSSSSVAEALVMHDNDTDKALAHFLNGSS
ncbi:Ubiquitin-associated domain [Sesbania bispinosa]|nr:Ubiquitin-associated domain [Sesbania bispinosa]